MIAPNPADLEALKANKDVKVLEQAGLNIGYLSMNTTKKPFDDVRVRQAINYAIDVDAIHKAIMGGLGNKISMVLPKEAFGYDESVGAYPFDPAKAKQLLAEAGYPNGFETEIVTYILPQWGASVQAFLGAVGIKAKLTQVQVQALIQRCAIVGECPLDLGSWGSYSINDVSAILPVFFGGGKDDHARDPETAKLIEAGGTTMDPEKRKTAYSAAIKRAMEQAYWVPLHTYVTTYGFAKNLDMGTQADEMPRFWLAKWK